MLLFSFLVLLLESFSLFPYIPCSFSKWALVKSLIPAGLTGILFSSRTASKPLFAVVQINPAHAKSHKDRAKPKGKGPTRAALAEVGNLHRYMRMRASTLLEVTHTATRKHVRATTVMHLHCS